MPDSHFHHFTAAAISQPEMAAEHPKKQITATAAAAAITIRNPDLSLNLRRAWPI